MKIQVCETVPKLEILNYILKLSIFEGLVFLVLFFNFSNSKQTLQFDRKNREIASATWQIQNIAI